MSCKSRADSFECAEPWGLYDMHGNVYEWCADSFGRYGAEAQTDPEGAESRHVRVFRGGGFEFHARHCRSAFRGYGLPGERSHYLGFRFVSGSAAGGGETPEESKQRGGGASDSAR